MVEELITAIAGINCNVNYDSKSGLIQVVGPPQLDLKVHFLFMTAKPLATIAAEESQRGNDLPMFANLEVISCQELSTFPYLQHLAKHPPSE